MSLVNVAYSAVLTWSNPDTKTLEEQALVPMFGEDPVELGLKDDGYLSRLRQQPRYREMFASAFPGEADPFTTANVTKAIASFERTIISARSPYDRYHYGREDGAVSEAAKRGEVLFFSHDIACFRCHGGFNFSDATASRKSRSAEVEFHNTAVTADAAKFKTPTLRNIALTAPYMHDGSIPTLENVLDHYAAGGRARSNSAKDPLIHGFTLSAADRADLIAFLDSLTDREVLKDPRFANPW